MTKPFERDERDQLIDDFHHARRSTTDADLAAAERYMGLSSRSHTLNLAKHFAAARVLAEGAYQALEERADHAYMERDRLRDECAAWQQRAAQAEYTVGFAMGTLTDLADAWESQKRGGSEAEADLLQRHADQLRRLVECVNKLGGATLSEAMIERAAEALRHPDHWPTAHYEGLTTAHANDDFESDTRAAAIAVLKAVMKP